MPDETPQPGWTYQPGDQPKATETEEQKSEEAEPNFAAPPEHASKKKASSGQSVDWTASEFISHHKSTTWYLSFIAVIALLSGGIYFLTSDVVSSGAIGIAGVLFIVLASHKPREMSYKIDTEGITIGSKFYHYGQFKSFGVHQEGAIGAINLMPLKRFMPELSIYYPPEHENEIVEILAYHLPHDQREEHHVDRLLKKIRF